ncbi:MAG: MmcQ/YjbR family DNA-binding protein [Flavobacteriales bacterium]|nr:MmcQ/YjbR family DNA-binding protein [Flavobacteriales bacterium]
MNIESYRDYCIAKKGVTEHFPFDESTLVFKVMGKMFALADVDQFNFINLKCDPDRAVELREQYQAVKPGYHMSKTHWNSVYVNQDASDQLVYQWIDDSYELIVTSLTKKLQQELQNL